MANQKRRRTDPDECTRDYIAKIEQCYEIELDLSLSSHSGSEVKEMQTLRIYQVTTDQDGEETTKLLATGPVRTGDNKTYNKNVQYVLTVALLRLMEERFER